jgi:hypothetical protein
MWFSVRAVSTKRETETASGLHRPGDPLRGVLQLVDPAAGVVVLDRAAHGPGLGCPRDRARGIGWIGAVAVLEVDRDRKLGRAVEGRRVGDHFVERDAAVASTEGEGEAGARCRERLESERGEDAG